MRSETREQRETKTLPVRLGAMDADGFLTIDEAASLLRKSKGTVYHYTSKGLIPFYKHGNRLLFRKQELVEFLQRHRRGVM